MPWLERKYFLGNLNFVDRVPENVAHKVAINVLFQNTTEIHVSFCL